jgi:hypothetical protein
VEFKIQGTWRADGVQYIKMLEQTNDAFGSFNDLESNEEKYSLSVTGKNLIPYLIIQGTNDQAVKWKNLIY